MRVGRESILPSIQTCIHEELSSVSLLRRLSRLYPCLLGKNRQRQSYYPQGMCSAQACWPWQARLGTPCLPDGCRKEQIRLYCHLVGRHVTELLVPSARCCTSPRTVAVSWCGGRGGGSEYRFLEALI